MYGYASIPAQLDVKKFLAKRMLIKTPTTIQTTNQMIEGVFQVSNGFTIDGGTTLPSPSAGVVIIGGTTRGNVVNLSASGTNGTKINLGNKPLAIVADTIKIDPNVTEINAILIANTIDLGRSTKPLKINGNIMNTGLAQIDTSSRSRIDNVRQPSLFIIFNPNQYMGVLKYLSDDSLIRVNSSVQ